uniref:Mitochondrial import inner membrane translocase subunit n=1 Tax=Stygiella incarcerata TaxID=1712417 RepID=A0A192ZIM9_9EUKA|nr:Tim9 [Stygiella incarcerata]
MDLSHLSEKQQAKLFDKLEDFQVRDAMRVFHIVSQRCFDQCVTSFRSSNLSSSEAKCLKDCAQKYFKHQQRVLQAFWTEVAKQQADEKPNTKSK